MATDRVEIVECPRDAWQGLPKSIPAEIKAEYLRRLIQAGFTQLDAVSFVSPAAVPQMADAERVLELLNLELLNLELLNHPPAPTREVEIIGIVVNERGARRAIETAAVGTLGFPYSVSPEFLKRNQRQSPEEALEALERIGPLAYQAGLGMVVYVSMAFGNPYGDAWNEEETLAACDVLASLGFRQISLADTVGIAAAELVESLVAAVTANFGQLEVGVHLHARPDQAAEKVAAAYRAGCRRFDTALGGLGGCPFAQDALVGNIPTETALAELGRLGAQLPRLGPIDGSLAASRAIASQFGAMAQ